jgi:hypothetical protein
VLRNHPENSEVLAGALNSTLNLSYPL